MLCVFYIPQFNKKKWNANPKKTDTIKILIMDNRTDFSLPYFVYTIRRANAINPMIRKIHAKTHNDNEGTIAIFNRFFYIQ